MMTYVQNFLNQLRKRLRVTWRRSHKFLGFPGATFSLLFGCVVCAFLVLRFVQLSHSHEEKQTLLVREEARQKLLEQLSQISIEGTSYAIYDMRTSKIVGHKHGYQMFPLASLTKLATALVASRAIAPDTQIIIPTESNLDFGLRAGDVWRRDDLIKYMLIFSSNDVADLLAKVAGEEKFLRSMNALAAEVGEPLLFINASGLDEGSATGGTGSAAAAAKLTALLYKESPGTLERTSHERATFSVLRNGKSFEIKGVPNTNQLLREYRGVIGSKTGFTDLAGGNLSMVFDIGAGRLFTVTVLGSSRDGRFTDVLTILNDLQTSLSTLQQGMKI